MKLITRSAKVAASVGGTIVIIRQYEVLPQHFANIGSHKAPNKMLKRDGLEAVTVDLRK